MSLSFDDESAYLGQVVIDGFQCSLAKELGIPYATTALVTDYDCWKEEEHVSFCFVFYLFFSI